MIFNLGGAAFKPPVLDPAYPLDVSVVQSASASATFSVIVSEPGEPAEYQYQWYVDNSPVSGANAATYTKTGLSSVETYIVYCKVTHPAGVVTSRSATLSVLSFMPSFSFNGTYEEIDDGNGNWRIKLKSSAEFTPINLGTGNGLVDIFCVGGGGGGNLSGGGGGYTSTVRGVTLASGQKYSAIVGAGGGVGARGGTTAFSSLISAAGGYPGKTGGSGRGGDGGSGGGDFGGTGRAGSGGSNGSDGYANWIEIYDSSAGWYWAEDTPAGQGQESTTTEFGEGGTLYAGGGGGGSAPSNGKNIKGYGGNGGGGGGACRGTGTTLAATSGSPNTGGGGGGGNSDGYSSKPGGSGIIVIRNHR